MANAIRELSSGKGFLFADRGDFIAKCFEKPVRVYEISWRNQPRKLVSPPQGRAKKGR